MKFDFSIEKIKFFKGFIFFKFKFGQFTNFDAWISNFVFSRSKNGRIAQTMLSFRFFSKQKFEKIDNINLTSFFLKVFFVMFQNWWKNSVKWEQVKIFCCTLGKTGHFWTWKLQNFELRHQNLSIPPVWCIRKERF